MEREEFEESVLLKLFHPVQIQYIDNFDDINDGWEISASFKSRFVIRRNMNNHMAIKITLFDFWAFPEHKPAVKSTIIWEGDIPADDNMMPDASFIRRLIKKYIK